MLAASMSFAGLKAVGPGLYEVGYEKASFKITNKGGSKVNGFKVTAYIRACRYSKGLTIPEKYLQLHGGKITSTTRLAAYLYKVELDFSNQTIPANGNFPSNGKYVEMALRNDAGKRFCTSRTTSPDEPPPQGDHDQPDFVVKNLSGKVLWGKAVKDDGNQRVGVLYNGTPKYTSCGTSIDREDTITLDTEDSDADTHVEAGNSNPPGIQIENKTFIKFSFCNEHSTPPAAFDYIVLKKDKHCPPGTYEFARYHDTEDNNNQNSFTGDIWPNEIDRNAKLYFCFVPKSSNYEKVYPYAKEYGVFANPGWTNIVTSEIFVDDEDSDNKNEWIGLDKLSSNIQKRIKNIMRGYNDRDKNTIYRVAMWNGLPLSKSADVADVHGSVNSAYVAAAPLAPAVKGLNRSAVAVELKSAGDVKVSIVGVNGAVIANVSEKNLQAGVHQIKWNAGMAPSGRYVVKVEQNGMVNAKNVILK